MEGTTRGFTGPPEAFFLIKRKSGTDASSDRVWKALVAEGSGSRDGFCLKAEPVLT